jgi:hypothetical protein
MDVVVNGDNEFQNQVGTDPIYHADEPFGPYMCTSCKSMYDDLSNLPKTKPVHRLAKYE